MYAGAAVTVDPATSELSGEDGVGVSRRVVVGQKEMAYESADGC